MRHELIWTHNNGYDSILLLDRETALVVSTWDTTDDTLVDLLAGSNPDDWDVHTANGTGQVVADYGRVVARWDGVQWEIEDGELLDGRLRFFFGDDAGHRLGLATAVLTHERRKATGVI